MSKKEFGIARRNADPFTLLRQMTSEMDRAFDETGWPPFRWPVSRARPAFEAGWFPGIDVFEKDHRLVTKVDLPGLKKEDVKVEIIGGQLAISGERMSEAEEKTENFYRCERQHGTFHRTVPLPEGVTYDDVKATFADGVLEISVPLPVKAETKPQKVEIQDAAKSFKAA